MKNQIDRRWLDPIDWVDCEFTQSVDEGKNEQSVKKKLSEINEFNFERIFKEVYELPVEESFEYVEPNDFDSIVKDIDKIKVKPLDKDRYISKLKGAWLGRIIGCEMGKPVEGLTRAAIKYIEERTGNYPLNDYFDNSKISDEFIEEINRTNNGFPFMRKWLKGSFDIALWDDDLNWTVLNMTLLERFGRDFTGEHVLKLWLECLPIATTFTAEKIAYKNAVNGVSPDKTATHANPFREWVGAGIRGDVFGYVNPSNPYLAAKMAFTDASVSHVKNGIYGEIYVSTLTSLAFTINDPRELILEAIKALPLKSRLVRDILKVVKSFDDGKNQKEVEDLIHAEYDENNRQYAVHVLPNMMVLTMALLYAKDDFKKVLRFCIDSGFDTDSTTAIAASVWGIIHGYESIDKDLYLLFNNTLQTTIFGIGTISIDELIDRTSKLCY